LDDSDSEDDSDYESRLELIQKNKRPATRSHKTNFKKMKLGGILEETNASPASPTVTAIKPTLMPPTMFLPSKEAAGPAPSTSQTTIKPEPLTRNQLLQALNYLLQTDEEFMKKLHETYLNHFE
jgi:hypothetical protein